MERWQHHVRPIALPHIHATLMPSTIECSQLRKYYRTLTSDDAPAIAGKGDKGGIPSKCPSRGPSQSRTMEQKGANAKPVKPEPGTTTETRTPDTPIIQVRKLERRRKRGKKDGVAEKVVRAVQAQVHDEEQSEDEMDQLRK